jgi:hypothetical protein
VFHAGGTHHAFADHGEGFCVFNDIGVSSAYALAVHNLRRILIIDLGVHLSLMVHGSEIFEPHHTTNVFVCASQMLPISVDWNVNGMIDVCCMCSGCDAPCIMHCRFGRHNLLLRIIK